MFKEIAVQLHCWPWSMGESDETYNLLNDLSSFPFYGSPVISISKEASLFLPQRQEKFVEFGPPFYTVYDTYQLFEAPHGILASKNTQKSNESNIVIKTEQKRFNITLNAKGAKSREEKQEEYSYLFKTILAWSQFFDDLIVEAQSIKNISHLPWYEIPMILSEYTEEYKEEPPMALIVDIAQKMENLITKIVNAARKLLIRERQMMPAGQVNETDIACLRWIIRQPGESLAQKAALNKQRLLGITRKESFDTLENRILKDFLRRCSVESKRYLKDEVGADKKMINSKRAKTVKRFHYLCQSLYQMSHMENISMPNPPIRPNYVLQNDSRYRKVWRHYRRLLRKEEEKDRIWDWQARTWADVARFLVNTSIYGLSISTDLKYQRYLLSELLKSNLRLLSEQHLGCRIQAGSEPGPFLIRHKYKDKNKQKDFVLEIVHPDDASEHAITKELGRLGGHLYLVFNPLEEMKSKVLVMWAVHTASSFNVPDWEDIAESARVSLKRHEMVLGERRINFPELHGFIVASDIEAKEPDLYTSRKCNLHLLQIGAERRQWHDALEGIKMIIEESLESII